MQSDRFFKMHGAGNDFIMIDNRDLRFPGEDADRIRWLCNRHHGVGGDGLVLIEPSGKLAFAMRFFNPDGGQADLCANGARCVARLAHDLGIAGPCMRFETKAGPLRAEILDDGVCIHLPPPGDMRREVVLGDIGFTVSVLNTGVPHVVVFTNSVREMDVVLPGRVIRNHPAFAPHGVNVNFVEYQDALKCLSVRTYERGVEGETLACGTGVIASALLGALTYELTSPVRVCCRHGDVMRVDFRLDEAGAFADVALTGPAEYIFVGSVGGADLAC